MSQVSEAKPTTGVDGPLRAHQLSALRAARASPDEGVGAYTKQCGGCRLGCPLSEARQVHPDNSGTSLLTDFARRGNSPEL